MAVVLAAGRGKRMGSPLPKVLHRAAGRPLVAWAVDAVRGAGCRRVLVVVGHGGERVREALAADLGDRGGGLEWVVQDRQLGTGDALARAEPHLGGDPATLLVVPGDAPLVTAATLAALAGRVEAGAWGAVAAADLERPGSLGRVIASPGAGAAGGPAPPDGGGERLAAIVEAADAGPGELAIRTVNTGFYALPAPEVFAFLARLESGNAQGEYYLTDAVVAAAKAGERVDLVRLADPDEARGVNTPEELAEVERLLHAAHRRGREGRRAGARCGSA